MSMGRMKPEHCELWVPPSGSREPLNAADLSDHGTSTATLVRVALRRNRQRIRSVYGKQLLRKRGETVERSFAHMLESGGLRRTHLRGRENNATIRGCLFPDGVEAAPENQPLATPVTGMKFKGKARLVNPLGVYSGGGVGTIAGSDLGKVNDWELLALRPLPAGRAERLPEHRHATAEHDDSSDDREVAPGVLDEERRQGAAERSLDDDRHNGHEDVDGAVERDGEQQHGRERRQARVDGLREARSVAGGDGDAEHDDGERERDEETWECAPEVGARRRHVTAHAQNHVREHRQAPVERRGRERDNLATGAGDVAVELRRDLGEQARHRSPEDQAPARERRHADEEVAELRPQAPALVAVLDVAERAVLRRQLEKAQLDDPVTEDGAQDGVAQLVDRHSEPGSEDHNGRAAETGHHGIRGDPLEEVEDHGGDRNDPEHRAERHGGVIDGLGKDDHGASVVQRRSSLHADAGWAVRQSPIREHTFLFDWRTLSDRVLSWREGVENHNFLPDLF